MADDAGTDAKKRRGRPAKVDAGGGGEKPKAEKRPRTDDSGPPAKKGRGRPKGSGGGRRRKKAKSPAKKKTTGAGRGGGRGRPKKVVAPAEEPDKSEQSSGAEQGEDE